MENIKENNELIAKFMGWKCQVRKNYNDNIKVLYTDKGNIFKYGYIAYLRNQDPWNAPLKYHTSWDWLMPVVEKISLMNNGSSKKQRFVFNTHRCAKYQYNSKDLPIKIRIKGVLMTSPRPFIEIMGNNELTCTYKAVVKFIEWYNKNK